MKKDMQVALEQLITPPGAQVLLKHIGWDDFEEILEESHGSRKVPRVSYCEGWLELMTPSAEHEYDKTIIGNFVEILLEELDREFIGLGSVTLKSRKTKSAVEPDECFYIQHESQIRGKDRIDLDRDPPPDLALEIDITQRTHFDNYEKLGIPELWRFNGETMDIFVLENGVYRSSDVSRQFPRIAVKQVIPQYLQKCKQDGRNKTMKAFRRFVKQSD